MRFIRATILVTALVLGGGVALAQNNLGVMAETHTVRDVQSWLSQLGYNPGPIDGSLGQRTRGALEAFYQDKELDFDGLINENEVNDLQAALIQFGSQPQRKTSSISTKNSNYFRSLDIHRRDSVPIQIRPSGPVPRWSSDGTVRAGYGDNREVYIINENFSVRRGEHVIIEDKIVRMIATGETQATIEILGNLEIRNSLIVWEQKFNQQVKLEVGQGGELSVVNSYGFASGPGWWNWEFLKGSTVNLDRAHIDVWTTASEQVDYLSQNYSVTRLTLFSEISNSRIIIRDSVQTDIEIFTPKRSKIDISVPSSGNEVNWNIDNFYPRTTIDVINSKIGRIDLTLTNNTDLTLRNYTDGQIGLVIAPGQGRRRRCSIDGFGDPSSMSGIRVSKRTWNIDCNNSSVTFINSNVVAFWFAMWGNMDLEVANSRLIDPTNAGCGARLTVRNSTMDLLRTRSDCGQNNTGKSFVANSRIFQGVDASGNGANVWLFDTEIGGGSYGQTGLVQIDGGKIEVINSDIPPW